MNDNNLFDKFLDSYEKKNNNRIEYRKVYVKPNRRKCIFGFIFSLIFFILILTLFTLNFMYFLLFFGSLAVLIYYAINLFTEKGFGLPKTVAIRVEDENKDEELEKDEVE